MLNRVRVRNGAMAAMVAAIAGGVGLMAIVLFVTVGRPFGTINDLAGLVMVGSLPPVMLAHYELGGPVPLWPARLSLGGAIIVVGAWVILQLAFIAGWLHVADVQQAATDGWAVQAVLLGLIGAWVAGASLLAGRWLPLPVRGLGILAGLGLVILAVGLMQGGYSAPLATVGGVGYQVLLPIWALLLGRVFRARGESAAPLPEGAAA